MQKLTLTLQEQLEQVEELIINAEELRQHLIERIEQGEKLIQDVCNVLKNSKLDELHFFLKTVKPMNYISSSLAQQLAIRFNCDLHILRFLIDSKSHSDEYFNNEDN